MTTTTETEAKANAGFVAGFVAIVGVPNVGKSTLLNRILGQKIAIASPRPQTTRNRILGVHNVDGAQLAFVDTPGVDRPRQRARNPLGKFMIDEALQALASVDAVLLLTEVPPPASRKKAASGVYKLSTDDEYLLAAVSETKKPVVLGINKVDTLGDKRLLLPILDAWSKAHPFAALVPLSAVRGDNVERVVDELVKILPAGERLFPQEMLTDRAERFLAAEMVREQVFLLTKQEVPYAVAVTIDQWEEREAHGDRGPNRTRGARPGPKEVPKRSDADRGPNRTRGARPGPKEVPKPGEADHVADVVIDATVHVEKDAQKGILIGEGGRMLREIGSRARHEIGKLLDCPVHLKLFVRVDPSWSQTASGIRKMGYE